jgi:hypothetical protein
MKRLIVLGPVLLLSVARLPAAPSFSFDVRHEHWRGHCAGRLTIDENGIEYATEHADHSRRWTYPDLKRIDIVSPKRLALLTYEDRKLARWAEREFEFGLQDGEITEAVYQMLRAGSTRPLISRVVYGNTAPLLQLPAKHRHRLGGCNGVFEARDDALVYSTEVHGEGRVWPYRDITSIGRIDPYSFRVSTRDETYAFDLKVAMTEEQYELLWEKVYQVKEPLRSK